MADIKDTSTTITHSPFGTLPGGSEVTIYTLKSAEVEASICTLGARVVSLSTRDRSGAFADITLGHNTIDGYLITPNGYLGAIAGRFANRIAKGQFTLDGTPHQLTLNNGPNSLHGGVHGFDRYNWTANEIPNGVEFSLVSP